MGTARENLARDLSSLNGFSVEQNMENADLMMDGLMARFSKFMETQPKGLTTKEYVKRFSADFWKDWPMPDARFISDKAEGS